MKNGPEPLVIFGSKRSLHGLFHACNFFSKTLLNFGYIDSSRNLGIGFLSSKIFQTRILKFSNRSGIRVKNVTMATSAFQKGPQFEIASGPENENSPLGSWQ